MVLPMVTRSCEVSRQNSGGKLFNAPASDLFPDFAFIHSSVCVCE